MTKDKTVTMSRDALKWAVEQLQEDGNKGCGYFDTLQAALAATVVERQPSAIERVDVQLLKGGMFRMAVEPDGTLVRYRDHCAQVEHLQEEIDRLNRVKLALAEKATTHADNCAVYRARLASPPAPVAVVLPERMEYLEADDDETIATKDAWNACLDRVKELNQ